jgi:aspartyl-tRNA(Asn)/glutamyl-tRNA(Gln) amidotransferase subunit A
VSGTILPQSISELHDGLRSRSLTVEQVVSSTLDRIASQRTLGAYLAEYNVQALERARDLDRRISREPIEDLLVQAPLFGVPFAIKDNLHIRGEITTCASRFLQNYRAPFDATCVSKLRDAGAVFVGKTNLDEFAMGGSGENSAFGPTLHPKLKDRVPGGSSSGSAVAVAADLALAALGSDTGGSIRLPAAFCGIAGLKPTYGRVSRFGLVAFGSSLDQVGPMARNVSDLISVYGAIEGHDARDATSATVARTTMVDLAEDSAKRPIRIGVPAEFFVEGVDPQVRSAIDGMLERLRDDGAELVPISLPNSVHSIPVYYVIAMAEASSNLSRYDGVRFGVRSDLAAQAESLEDFYSEARTLFGPEVKRRILLGSFVLSAGYHDAYYKKACQVRRLIADDFKRAFERVDVIAGPVAPCTAFPLGAHQCSPLQMYLNDLFTIPANLAGLPAVSVPIGEDSAGLPIGLQLIGKPFDESGLLRVALDVEALR